MSAGYLIYSLDWEKFRKLAERPTQGQLTALGKLLRDGLEEQDGEFEDGDPVLDWPTDVESLAQIAANRLALPDWYGDLSGTGKTLWESVVFNASMNCDAIDVGFRVENDGVYWDAIEIAWKHLGVPPNTITEVVLSTFGTRPFRYHQHPKPKKSCGGKDARNDDDKRASLDVLGDMLGQFLESAKRGQKDLSPEKLLGRLQEHDGISQKHKNLLNEFLSETPADSAPEAGGGDDVAKDWSSMHSMHTPNEVQKMRAELKSVKPSMKATKKKDASKQYEEDLMPAIARVASDGRMLFIQVDT